jgi:hypothetical protein
MGFYMCVGCMEFSTNWWLPLTYSQRTKARNIKLWKRDEARVNAIRLEWYKCPCQICPSAWPLKRTTIQKHFLDFGHHPCNEGWIKVQYAWCSPLKSSYNPMVHSEWCMTINCIHVYIELNQLEGFEKFDLHVYGKGIYMIHLMRNGWQWHIK